jgi:hypothetical protein
VRAAESSIDASSVLKSRAFAAPIAAICLAMPSSTASSPSLHVEMARRQVGGLLDALLHGEDALDRHDVVVGHRLRIAVEGVHLRHRDAADDGEREDHDAEGDAEAIREPEVVEAGQAPPGRSGAGPQVKAGVARGGALTRAPCRPRRRRGRPGTA